MSLSYEGSGVRYEPLDAFKRACQKEGYRTIGQLEQHGLREVEASRGDSAYLVEADDCFLAHVEEGLGTKNLVADAMEQLTGRCFYAGIGVDTVATIVNDMVTSGALPLTVAMHAAVGDSGWFENERRSIELARGFAEGCRLSGATWGGGETPALKGIVVPGTILLSGSGVGRIKPKSLRVAGQIGHGDLIVLLASSGVHTNGLTLCRALADRLPRSYLTEMEDGRSFGEALLDPSIIYAGFVRRAQADGIGLKYLVHMTGHGWRKLMRHKTPFVYRVEDPGVPPQVFRFIQRAGNVSAREMYATYNMGAGFAAIVGGDQVDRCLSVARETGYHAWVGGVVREEAGRKAVEIPGEGLVFEEETLRLR
jgi:phosphoribosylformylglycinamidine cyclo-ligase